MRITRGLLYVILTATLGRIAYGNHIETWYNLPMDNVIDRAYENGICLDYWERKDGMKMFGKYVIVATDESISLGTVVETSRGKGIVLDRHETESNVYDLATTWE